RAVFLGNAPTAGKATDSVGSHIASGEHSDDAAHRLGCFAVDRKDARMRHRRPDDPGIDLLWPVDIVGVAAFPGDKPPVFLAPYRGTDTVLRHLRVLLPIRRRRRASPRPPLSPPSRCSG